MRFVVTSGQLVSMALWSKAIITRFNIRQQKVDAMLITSHLWAWLIILGINGEKNPGGGSAKTRSMITPAASKWRLSVDCRAKVFRASSTQTPTRLRRTAFTTRSTRERNCAFTTRRCSRSCRTCFRAPTTTSNAATRAVCIYVDCNLIKSASTQTPLNFILSFFLSFPLPFLRGWLIGVYLRELLRSELTYLLTNGTFQARGNEK